MLKAIADEVKLPHNKLRTVMHKYANIAGASVPITLDDVKQQGILHKGDKLLLTAIGSGWAWGSIIINYE